MKTLSKVIRKAERSKVQLFTKSGELTKHVASCIRRSLHGTVIRPVDYRGSGNYITKRDNTLYFTELLKAAGYKYEEGNDAPRGGQAGNYIKISKPAADFLLSLIN